MITAKEALEAVKSKTCVDWVITNYRPHIAFAEQIVIDHVGKGWLCANIGLRVTDKIALYEIEDYFRKLGYIVDANHIIYWLFN